MSGFLPDQDDRQRVRDASDIVAVVGEHLSLKPKGREYVGLCPFHDDRNPSMCVIPGKQIFHCFVCGAGGDVFTFVQKYHSMGFREALEFLAERSNIELTKLSKSQMGSSQQGGIGRKEIMHANDVGQAFFQAVLSHPEHGFAARQVIEHRGIAQEMVERFGLGVSMDRWDALMNAAQKKNVPIEALIQAGLLKQRDSGGQYDAFRNRLMFPIRDQIGRVVAFGARKINEEDEPKYLNSAETPVFHKSSTLYGLDLASRAIKRERTAVIVEGYTDVIACHQAGIDHVVATLGTALTSGHATMLRRLCDTVVLLFDGDAAGIKAADRAIEVLFSETIDIKIASLAGFTDAKDPDELLKQDDGASVFREVIANSTDLMKWRFDRLREELHDAGPARVTQRVEEELERLSGLGLAQLTPVRRRLMIKQIAHAAGVTEQAVMHAVNMGRRGPREGAGTFRSTSNEGNAQELNWKPNARETLLGCLLYEPNLWLELSGEERELTRTTAFDSPLSRQVADAMQMSAENGTGTGLHAVLDELSALADGDSMDSTSHSTSHGNEHDSQGMINSQQRATMLCQLVGRDSEDSSDRVERLFRECIASVALEDDRASHTGLLNGGNHLKTQDQLLHNEFKENESDDEVVDEAAKLKAFIEKQRGMRQKYGRSGKNTLSGE